MAASLRTDSHRPNGRLSACDPCRLRKVACNHARPVCSRCRRKGRDAQCFYSATAVRKDRREATPPQPQMMPMVIPALTPALTPSTAKSFSSLPAVRLSHTSPLDDVQGSLALTNISSSPCDVRERKSSLSSLGFHQLSPLAQETCRTVLRALPGRANEQMIYLDADAVPEPFHWSYIAVERILSSISDMFISVRDQSEQAATDAVAQMICKNTSQPFGSIHDDFPTCDAWLDRFCSQDSVRWESIGLLWAHLERVSNTFDSTTPRRLVRAAGNTSNRVAREHLGYCLELAGRFTDCNDLLVDLWRRQATMNSHIDGDAAMATWKAKSAAVACMTFLGLQCIPDNQPYVPTARSEHLRRIAAQIFVTDKAGVAFNGRPSHISYRYFTTPLPLDLDDEHLIADRAILDAAVASLDSNGWNTEGRVSAATVIRAQVMAALIRDELAEAVLGKSSTALTRENLLEIHARQVAMAQAMPSCLQYKPEDLEDEGLAPHIVFCKVYVHLDQLLNIFFVQRLLLRLECDGGSVHDELLTTSYTMLSLLLHLWTHKDRFSNTSIVRDFEWVMLSYGAPGAGILCAELLHPTPIHASTISRSDIVMKLGLLVSFFDWVKPTSPDAKLCANCKDIIQRVLRQHLDDAAPTEKSSVVDWTFMEEPGFGFSFELMDTFDWMRQNN